MMDELSFMVNFPSQMIKKDLKKYSKIFEQKDRLSQSKASKVWPLFQIALACRGFSELCVPI